MDPNSRTIHFGFADMSFLFGRRPRTNTVDLPKQLKEQMGRLEKLDGAQKEIKETKVRPDMLKACCLLHHTNCK